LALTGDASQDRGPAQIVAFSLDERRYGIDLGLVQRVVPMVAVTPLPEAPPITLGAFNLHGLVVPVLDIRRRCGLPDRPYGLSAQLLVARTSRRALAIPVDEVLGVLDVAPEEVTAPSSVLDGVERVSGIVTLADGLLFIYDLETFLSLDEEEQLARAVDGIDHDAHR
jgi:purine-binding chemotaxis protein CheW